MSITVTLNIDGPREPGYVLEVAEAIPEAVRVLNHLTRDHAALREPPDVDRLLRYLESAEAGHQQLLEQITGWLKEERAADGIRVTGGPFAGDPAGAIARIRAKLDRAKFAVEMLRTALGDAASVTSDLAAPASPRPTLRAHEPRLPWPWANEFPEPREGE